MKRDLLWNIDIDIDIDIDGIIASFRSDEYLTWSPLSINRSYLAPGDTDPDRRSPRLSD